MDIFKYFDGEDKQQILARVNATAAVVADLFHNRGDDDIASFRNINSIAKGYESAGVLVDKLANFQLIKLVQGKEASSELINRLLTIKLGDLTPERFKSEADITRLLVKLCVEAEKNELKMHRSRIVVAWKGVEVRNLSLGLLLYSSGFASEEAPEIKEFYEQTGLEDLTNSIVLSDARAVGFGGYATVYETNLARPHLAPRKVAVKVLRMFQYHLDDNAKLSAMRRRLRREICIWQSLRHSNIVPLLGLTHRFDNSPLPSMVCPWMESGTLADFLRKDLSMKERLKLLIDVIEGLSYCNTFESNVLISEDKACLSDFGLSKIISQHPGTSYMTSEVAGVARWAAPELFRMTFDINGKQEPIEITKACDIYSYGCIMQEVISRKQPYFNILNEPLVILQKAMLTPPPRPPEPLLTDEIWSFIQLCWRDRPGQRPEASQVARKIQTIYDGYSSEALQAKLAIKDEDIP